MSGQVGGQTGEWADRWAGMKREGGQTDVLTWEKMGGLTGG
jgi:hypothetical protein